MEIDKALELIMPAHLEYAERSVWADLGCGNGIFTSALTHLLERGSTIYAVDSNESSLKKIQPSATVNIQKMKADFIKDELPFQNMNGILMANSLHFVNDKHSFLSRIRNWLMPGGNILLVEYDTDKPNSWVPFPINFDSAKKLFDKPEYSSFIKLGELPSIYNRANLYSVHIKCQ